MSFRIGSFNIYKFQAFRTDDEIKKDVEKISQIIKDSEFDIIAFQEIFSKTSMERLLSYLGMDWEGRWCSPPSVSSIAAEGYAFIWNKRKFRLVRTELENGVERIFEPHIFNQYKINRLEGQTELIRNPYYARFEPVHGPFCEIRILNAHIMFSKSKTRETKNGEDESLGDIIMRKNEFNVLTKALYPKIADKIYGNNRPGYTILLGDYNLNLRSSGAKSPFLIESFEIIDGEKNPKKQIVTVQKDLTTLKLPPKDDSQPDENVNNYWANNYDHFTYDANRFKGIGMKAGRIDSIQYCKDYAEHRRTISDHVPVRLDIDFRNGR